MKLSDELVSEFRTFNILIEHHKQIVKTLEEGMRNRLEEVTGVDTTQTDYRLDLEKGTLDAVTE